ncbi:MAG: ABC transporter substrate-binding protein [Pseudonocardia sp. SCN 72-86]|nr:MAG: ABC transporter substrate-binding protein [Pseudonocardia sp. SCN 72-86]
MLPTNRPRRRPGWGAAAVVLAVALVAGACSGQSQDVRPGNTDVATGGKQFSTADEATAKFGADAAPGVFPRTVTHANGTTRLERKPERVAVLDSGELDDVIALGLTPVVMANPNNTAPTYLADKTAGVATAGDVSTLNLETIAAAKPDLILGSKLRADQLYPQLSAIAPTVLSIRPGFPWKENLLLVGAATGEEAKAVELLNGYQRRADAVREKVSGDPPTISMVRFMPGRIRLYGNLSFIGVVLKDVGLPRPAAQNFDELATEVSAERIDQADGGWILYSSYGPPERTGQTTVLDSALWKGLPGVASGHVRPVDDETWFLGLGPIGAGRVLDDLERLLGT